MTRTVPRFLSIRRCLGSPFRLLKLRMVALDWERTMASFNEAMVIFTQRPHGLEAANEGSKNNDH